MNNLWDNILASSIVVAAFLVALIVFYYVTTYLGLKKRRNFILEFQEKLKIGKMIMFGGGMVGKIIDMDDEFLIVEINKGNNATVSRYGIIEIVEEKK